MGKQPLAHDRGSAWSGETYLRFHIYKTAWDLDIKDDAHG